MILLGQALVLLWSVCDCVLTLPFWKKRQSIRVGGHGRRLEGGEQGNDGGREEGGK